MGRHPATAAKHIHGEKMKVKGIKTEEATVTLSVQTIKLVMRDNKLPLSEHLRALRWKFKVTIGVEPSAFIRDGKWYYEEEHYGGSHSWSSDEFIRDATVSEIEYMHGIQALEELNMVIALKG